eukprot:ANDGO_02902.mRNA.1 tRNA-splicing endonuclease
MDVGVGVVAAASTAVKQEEQDDRFSRFERVLCILDPNQESCAFPCVIHVSCEANVGVLTLSEHGAIVTWLFEVTQFGFFNTSLANPAAQLVLDWMECRFLICRFPRLFALDAAFPPHRDQRPSTILYEVFEMFTNRGWIVKRGSKFGADFVLYARGPGFDHSKYMVKVCVDPNMSWTMLQRLVRLATAVRKTILVVDPARSTVARLMPRFRIEGIEEDDDTAGNPGSSNPNMHTIDVPLKQPEFDDE